MCLEELDMNWVLSRIAVTSDVLLTVSCVTAPMIWAASQQEGAKIRCTLSRCFAFLVHPADTLPLAALSLLPIRRWEALFTYVTPVDIVWIKEVSGNVYTVMNTFLKLY